MTSPLPPYPQVIVEAGFSAPAPVAPPGTMTLDDAVNGLLDTDVLNAAITWTDISPFVLNMTITRPSTRQQGPLLQFQAGTASFLLDNTDLRFDPDNLAGPYVVNGVPQITPMVPVRARAVYAGITYPLFFGFADGWTETASGYEGGYSEWTLAATDAFKVLAGITLAALGSPAGAGELSGARIQRILTSAMWYTGTNFRTVGAGNSAVQATSYGDTALNLMQVTADSEIGQLYIDGAGSVVFRGRQALISDTRSATVQATFGDRPVTGIELPYATVSRADDDTTIGNDIQATRVGGVLQEVTDAASIAKYLFPRTYTRSDLILQGDSDVVNWAGWILYVSKSGENRFDTLTVDPLADPDELYPQVLGRQMGDRIRVIKRPDLSGVPDTQLLVTDDQVFAASTGTWTVFLGSIARVIPPVAPPAGTFALALREAFGGSVFFVEYAVVPGASLTWTVNFLAQTAGAFVARPGAMIPGAVRPGFAGTGLTCQVFMQYRSSDNLTLLGASSTVSVTDNPVTWTQATVSGTAPDGCFIVSAQVRILSEPPGDTHYIAANSLLSTGSVVKQAFISGITHTADFTQSSWQTGFTLQDASKYGSFMTLDNVTTGQLDKNALVF